MPVTRYPEEVKEWLYEYVKTHTNRECAEAAQNIWPEWNLTVGKIKNLRYYQRSRAPGCENRPYGRGGVPNLMTQETYAFLLANYKGKRSIDLTALINETFGTSYTNKQIRDFLSTRGLRTEAPNTPDIAYNAQPIGSVREIKSGGHLKKVGKRKWKSLGAATWEEHYGPIPKGYRVIVLDGDTSNCSLDNLMLVSHGEQSRANLKGLRTENSDLTKAKILNYRLKDAIKERSKETNEKEAGTGSDDI